MYLSSAPLSGLRHFNSRLIFVCKLVRYNKEQFIKVKGLKLCAFYLTTVNPATMKMKCEIFT